jgi:oxygen-independent coproporphyrinogen-3 oxidase
MEWNDLSEADQSAYDPAEVFAAGLALHHIANTAYPIGHLTTMRPYRVPQSQVRTVALQAWGEVDRLGLYVHIPFCESRCAYCEYAVVDSSQNGLAEGFYFDMLMKEFELYRGKLGTESKRLVGLDIGGGTPALAPAAQLGRVVEAAGRCFQLPEEVTISIETTPKIAATEPGKMRELRALGIGRVSMGIQTVNARLLQQIGRENATMALNRTATEHIRAAGFQRFNVDLMYGFARQSLASWEATLAHAISLDPEYVTLYRMRYKGTKLAEQAAQVSREAVNSQYELASRTLKAAGYQATPGKNTFSRLAGDAGTSDYLTERVIHGTPYLGLGLAAQSLSHKTLSYNSGAASKAMRPYQKQVEAGELPIQDLYHLSRPAAMGKMIAVSFYFGEIRRSSFQQKFGVTLEAAYPAELAFLRELGLMEMTAETLRLTPAGVAQVNGVIALFYAGAVKAHLIRLAGDAAR